DQLYGWVGEVRARIDEMVAHVCAHEVVGAGFGPVAEADASSPAWYRENAKAMRHALEALHAKLVEPIAAELEGADPVLVLPSGLLCFPPSAALVGPAARFLAESKRLVPFTSRDDLAATLAALRRPASAAPAGDVWVAFADPRGKLSSSL